MLRQSFAERLSALRADQQDETTELVDEYIADMMNLHATVLNLAQEKGSTAAHALALSPRLEDTSVGALAQMIVEQKPFPRADMMLDLAAGVEFAETAVTQRLKAALSDTRLKIQPPRAQLMEEALPPSRVCDEAYGELRRLLMPESLLQYLLEMRQFLSLDDAAKDQEIDAWRRTGAFTRFLDDVDAEE